MRTWVAGSCLAEGHCLQLALRQLLKGKTRVLPMLRDLQAQQRLETAL